MRLRWIGVSLATCLTMTSGTGSAQISIGVSVRLAPPPLPVYAQPPLPGPDFLWTPGYWAWDDYALAYYWVPGTWIRAPRPGLLWTPPWWGWSDGAYIFHTGYWGPHIGFYGGVNYGFGYTGFGYQGGYWNGGHLFYNQTVNNITNIHVTNVYQTNIINVTNNSSNRVSYNGGPGGVRARPRPEEQLAARDQHIAPTAHQQDHVLIARSDPRAFVSANRGHPPLTATPRALGNRDDGVRADQAASAAQRNTLSGHPGRPHPSGMVPGGLPPMARASQTRGPLPERFGDRPDYVFGAPPLQEARAAMPNRYVDPGDPAFARGPRFVPDRQGHGSNPSAPPPQTAQPPVSRPPHVSKPPQPSRPPHPHIQGHHDDHHG